MPGTSPQVKCVVTKTLSYDSGFESPFPVSYEIKYQLKLQNFVEKNTFYGDS